MKNILKKLTANTQNNGFYNPIFAIGPIVASLSVNSAIQDRVLPNMADEADLIHLHNSAIFVSDAQTADSAKQALINLHLNQDTTKNDFADTVSKLSLGEEASKDLQSTFEAETDAKRNQLNPGTSLDHTNNHVDAPGM